LGKNEQIVRSNNTTMSLSSNPSMHHSTFDSREQFSRGSRPSSSLGGSNGNVSSEWKIDNSINLDDSYMFLFGDRIMQELEILVRKVHTTKLFMEKNLFVLEQQQKRKNRGKTFRSIIIMSSGLLS
jgi:hypothetical protein